MRSKKLFLLLMGMLFAIILTSCGGGGGDNLSLLPPGSLEPDFGTDGVVQNNPSGNSDFAGDIAIDSTYIYVVGSDESPGAGNGQWRIEKRVK